MYFESNQINKTEDLFSVSTGHFLCSWVQCDLEINHFITSQENFSGLLLLNL